MALQPTYSQSQRRIILPSSCSSASSSSIHSLPCMHETVISIDGGVSRTVPFRPSRAQSMGDGRELRTAPATVGGGGSRRLSLMSSVFWVSVELFFTVAQIISAVVVLGVSQNEQPATPLPVWVIGYAIGCAASLPLLYWRYTNHPSSIDLLEHHDSWPSNNPMPISYSGDMVTSNAARGSRLARALASIRIDLCMERLRMSLDCFFAVWFVLGNVWVFGRPSSAQESPNLYRLSVAFLALSCVSYAMPFVLCAAVCCCLPCVITLLGFRESQVEGRGATADMIATLPIYQFQSKKIHLGEEKNHHDSDAYGAESDNDCLSDRGVMGAGTENGRIIAGEDATCCICLGRYKDSAQLRGLPCQHHFHVECIDQWLKINASCPLCKFSLQHD